MTLSIINHVKLCVNSNFLTVLAYNEINITELTKFQFEFVSGRWRFTLDLFGRVFVDDVGLEPGSIISELGGFPVKEAKFRREMEKLRNSRTVDLTLSKIERERNQLIVQVRHDFVESCRSKNLIFKIQKLDT